MRFRAAWMLGLALLGCSSKSEEEDVVPVGDAVVDQVPGDSSLDAETVGDVGSDLTTDGVVPDGSSDATDQTTQADEVVLPQCSAWSNPWGSTALYEDASVQWNLGEEGLAVYGNRVTSVDLDGDDYPDLIIHSTGSNDRDDPEQGVFKRRILMNRPAPGGGRTFEDYTVTSRYGQIVAGPDAGKLGRAAHFGVYADADNQGGVDVFSGTYSDANNATKIADRSIVLLNDGTGVFTAAPASEVSPEQEWTTTSASWVDYDRDGWVDVWTGNFYVIYGYESALQDRLYRNNGDGTFTDVTNTVGLTTSKTGFDEGTNHRPTYGVTACDVDGDGFTDLLQSSYGRQLNMLWKNFGGKTFMDIAEVTHYDADDNLDYSDNNFYRCYCYNGGTCDPKPEQPMIDCSSFSWNANDTKPYRNGGNTFTTLCADLDGDGDNDVYNAEIVHWHIGQSSDPSQVLKNEPSENEYGFEFVRPGREATGLTRQPTMVDWNEGDIYAVAFDADNDGIVDLYQPSSDYPGTHGWLFRGTGGGVFANADSETSVSGLSQERVGGGAVADFDRDGDLDVVLAYSTMRCDASCQFSKPVVRMFENKLDGRGHWIRIRLQGKGAGGSNRSGVGARVTIETGDHKAMQELGGGYGHFGMQNTLTLHFGLGDKCYVQKVRIAWPNSAGTVSEWSGVLEADAEYLVDEATGDWFKLVAGQEPQKVVW